MIKCNSLSVNSKLMIWCAELLKTLWFDSHPTERSVFHTPWPTAIHLPTVNHSRFGYGTIVFWLTCSLSSYSNQCYIICTILSVKNITYILSIISFFVADINYTYVTGLTSFYSFTSNESYIMWATYNVVNLFWSQPLHIHFHNISKPTQNCGNLLKTTRIIWCHSKFIVVLFERSLNQVVKTEFIILNVILTEVHFLHKDQDYSFVLR